MVVLVNYREGVFLKIVVVLSEIVGLIWVVGLMGKYHLLSPLGNNYKAKLIYKFCGLIYKWLK